LGIIVEDKSIRFYSLCKAQVSSSSVKEELENIIAEEARHKQLLKNIAVK